MKFKPDYFTRESFKVKQKWKTSMIWNQKRNHDPTRPDSLGVVLWDLLIRKKVLCQEVQHTKKPKTCHLSFLSWSSITTDSRLPQGRNCWVKCAYGWQITSTSAPSPDSHCHTNCVAIKGARWISRLLGCVSSHLAVASAGCILRTCTVQSGHCFPSSHTDKSNSKRRPVVPTSRP